MQESPDWANRKTCTAERTAYQGKVMLWLTASKIQEVTNPGNGKLPRTDRCRYRQRNPAQSTPRHATKECR